MKTIISRLTMRKRNFAFTDMVENKDFFYYVDRFGDVYLADPRFYPWSVRCKI